MKKPAKSNMYLDAKLESLAFCEHAVQGDVDAAVCIASYGEPSEGVKEALFAACAGIGAPDPCVLDVAALSPADSFAALEGLDPQAIIVADELAASLLSQAYRANVALDAQGRLFGRSYAAFSSFEADLADARAKQRDWALIKRLKHAL